MDMSLSKLWELVMDREVCRAALHGITESKMTEQLELRLAGRCRVSAGSRKGSFISHLNISPYSFGYWAQG